MSNKKKEGAEAARNKDIEMVELMKKGDRRGYELLYDTYKAQLFNYIMSRGVPYEDAQDLLQKSIFKIATKVETFNPNKSNFRSWCYNVTKNQTIDFLRYKRLQTARPMDVDDERSFMCPYYNATDSGTTPDETMDISMAMKVLMDSLEEIKDSDKNGMIYWQKFIEGKKYVDLAFEHNENINNLKGRLMKIRKKTLPEAIESRGYTVDTIKSIVYQKK